MSTVNSDPDFLALQGTWKQIAFEQNGVDEPPDSHGASGSLTTIIGNRFRVETVEGDLILKGMIELDTSATPKIIIWTDEDGPKDLRSLECSYLLEEDRLVFIGAQDGGPRPLEFKRTQPGQTMRSFVRWRKDQGAGEGP